MRIKKLLIMLLLHQTAGAGDSIDDAIKLALELYCNMYSLNEEQVANDINTIKKNVWQGKYYTMETQDELQKQYEYYLNKVV